VCQEGTTQINLSDLTIEATGKMDSSTTADREGAVGPEGASEFYSESGPKNLTSFNAASDGAGECAKRDTLGGPSLSKRPVERR